MKPTRLRNRLALPCLALLAALAAGCADMPPVGTSAEGTAERAETLAEQGNYARAAALYRQAAQRAERPQRSRYYLQAARFAARAGDGELADELLGRVDRGDLDQAHRDLLELARIEVDVADLPPSKALQQIPAPASGASPAVAAGIWGLRAELLLEAGRTVDGINALVQRDLWLLEPGAIRANDNRIWQAAVAAPDAARDRQALAATDEVTRGWLQLAAIENRAFDSRAALEEALAAWERHHPGHPATRHILPQRFDYQPEMPIAFGPDGRGAEMVGLALPLSGDFAIAAETVRDGFLAAYFRQSAPRPGLRVYDTAAMPDMLALLARARSDAVDILVGPLSKERVAELAELPAPTIPVLALNYADTGDRFRGFYQFGLAPEDEARAVARRAAANGWLRGLALVPLGQWGGRVLGAFREAMFYAGGELVDYAFFAPWQQDHSVPIKTLLQYDAEAVRKAKEEEEAEGEDAETETAEAPESGEPVETGTAAGETGAESADAADEEEEDIELGRRQDADFIFLAAQPGEARLIRTQLRFYRAAQLPVLATSHVYTGKADPNRDGDLDGLMFADMPWALNTGTEEERERRRQIRARWDTNEDHNPRLFAMGLDAWRLVDRLRTGDFSPGPLFPGATGELYLESDGQIRRQLDWAYFANGRPRTLPPPEETPARAIEVRDERRERAVDRLAPTSRPER